MFFVLLRRYSTYCCTFQTSNCDPAEGLVLGALCFCQCVVYFFPFVINKDVRSSVRDARLVTKPFLHHRRILVSAWRIKCQGWEHKLVFEFFSLQHEVQCGVYNLFFVLLNEWWEKWKQVVTQVCRRCLCCCAVFYFYTPSLQITLYR